MGISVHDTTYGRPATELLHARVAAAKARDPLRPVTVVVPTNYVGVSVRRLLGSGRLGPIGSGDGIAGLALLTVYRLAELLGAPRLAAAGRRPVSTPVVAAAVRAVLAADPGVFAAVRTHPATEESLVRVHRELSDCTPPALDRLADCGSRAAEVVRIHRAVRERLGDDWYDEADLMGAATTAVTDGAPVLADLGRVLLHLPQDLSPAAGRLIAALGAAADVEVLAARTGVERADAELDRTLDRIGAGGTGEAPRRSMRILDADTRVISVSDADEEARAAVDAVVTATRDGVPLERIALLYPSHEPYGRIVHEHVTAAGIPYNGASVRPLADRLAGRWLLDVLDLAAGMAPGRGLARPDVMNVLAAAPVSRPDGRPVPTGPWERISREAGVVRGEDHWTGGLETFVARRREAAEAEADGDHPRDWLADRWRRQAGHAEDLRAFMAGLLARLRTGRGLSSWGALAAWCHGLLDDYLADGLGADAPAVEREAADALRGALDRLAGLDQLAPDTDLPTFRRTLELELDSDLGRVGRFGEGLLVGLPTAALGVDLDVVVMLGLAEGVFPTLPREDSLLADRERAVAADELRPRRDRVHVEHRHLLAALAAASRRRILVHPRGDLRRSTERTPSRWLLDLCERRTGERSLPSADADWFEEVPSFAGRIRSAPFPPTEQHWRLRSLGDHRRAGGLVRSHPLHDHDRALRASVALVDGRGGDGFTRFDGNLAEHTDLLPAPTDPDTVMSVSRLEQYAACPHAYLMKHVLHLGQVDNPEDIVAISPLDRGRLLHSILEEFVGRAIEEGALPPPHEPWTADARDRLAAIAERWFERYRTAGRTGHELLWQRDRRRLRHDLQRFLAEDARRRRGRGLTPAGVEVGFGAPEPVEIDLGDGRTLRLRGSIDRVDDCDDGVVVTDYKTGRSRYYQDVEDTVVDGGTTLQLPLYAHAIRSLRGDEDLPVTAEFWFATSRGGFDTVGYDVDEDVLATFRSALRVIVDGIEAGRFPARPAEPKWLPFVPCEFCDPDELGTADRWRGWVRLRQHPDLEDYVRLVDPEALA